VAVSSAGVPSMRTSPKRRSASRERRTVYQEDHRAIVAALRARDTDAAVEAMRVHLTRVAGHLLGETR
jgi:DNA-binding FadR family transcriptional regulator